MAVPIHIRAGARNSTAPRRNMAGTVNISRSIWADTAFKDQPLTEREAFMWLIMEASFVPREKRVGNVVVNLDRGQLACAVRFMADAWGWSKSTVQRFLDRLKKRDMIGTDSGTGVLVITVCKYDEYQTAIDVSGTGEKTKAGQQRDSSGTNYNNYAITNKKDTNVSYLPATLSPEKTTPSVALDDVKIAVDLFNDAAGRVGWPRAQKLTDSRKQIIRARISEHGLDGWREALTIAEQSAFLSGRAGRGNFFCLDWMAKAANFTKIIEGNYNDRPHSAQHASNPRAGRNPDALRNAIDVAGTMRRTSSEDSF